MTNFSEIVKQAHELATAAMAEAKAAYIARVKAQGEEAWQKAVRNCGGERAVEPLYCGRASVIVPRKPNAAFVAEMKAAGARWAGSAVGYSRKGFHTPTDWSFYCPGEYGGQSMDIYETGAQAFLAHLQRNGVVGCFMTSRAD